MSDNIERNLSYCMVKELTVEELSAVSGGKKAPPVELTGGGSCGEGGCNIILRPQVNIPVNNDITVSPWVNTHNGIPNGGGAAVTWTF